jgi:hypothetical protein
LRWTKENDCKSKMPTKVKDYLCCHADTFKVIPDMRKVAILRAKLAEIFQDCGNFFAVFPLV